MGSYLYPNTKVPTNLEHLAGVRPGTYDRLQALKEVLKKVWPDGFIVAGNEDGRNQDLEAAHLRLQALSLDPELLRLHVFLSDGWGRVMFHPCQQDLIEQFDNRACGGTTSVVDCILIFKVMDIDRDLLLYTEGLHWC